MRRAKKIGIVCVGILMVVFMFLSYSNLFGGETKRNITKISVIGIKRKNSQVEDFKRGIEEAANAKRVDVEYLEIEEDYDTIKEYIDREIKNGSQALIVFSEKEEQILSYLQSEKKKIPLILVNPGGTEEKTIRVWFDVQDMAECLAEKPGHLPVQVKGAAFGGKKPADKVQVDISESTQFLSALLMVAPMLENGLKIHITSRKTDGSYIRITTKMMHQFGCNVVHEGSLYAIAPAERYIPGTYQIEPDVSAACYFYAAAALTGGHVIVKNVHSTSMQGDMKFIDVLKQMGCAVTEEREGICVTGPKDGVYSGVDIDMNDFSDQTMTLAALAPFAQTPTYIRNIGHIRLQESDRIHAIVTELTRLGIEVKEEESAILIYPGTVKPGIVSTYDDHRMAMAFALLGIRAEGIVIDNCECCRKTFEDYFKVLDRVLA